MTFIAYKMSQHPTNMSLGKAYIMSCIIPIVISPVAGFNPQGKLGPDTHAEVYGRDLLPEPDPEGPVPEGGGQLLDRGPVHRPEDGAPDSPGRALQGVVRCPPAVCAPPQDSGQPSSVRHHHTGQGQTGNQGYAQLVGDGTGGRGGLLTVPPLSI